MGFEAVLIGCASLFEFWKGRKLADVVRKSLIVNEIWFSELISRRFPWETHGRPWHFRQAVL
jgi:hypothetical protein